MVPDAPSLDVVLFDVDDTLYSTTEFARTARRNAIRAMIREGLQVGEEEGFVELDEVVAEFTSNYVQHFDRLLDRLGRNAWGGRNPAVLVAAGIVAYHRTKESEMHILPDAKALLEAIKATTLRMGILTAGLSVKQAEKLVRLGVLPYLDPGAIFLSDQMGIQKPNPKIFLRACQGLGTPPARVMYVGDRVSHDVAPAKSAGLRTVRYSGAHGRWCQDATPVPADHEVTDLRELVPILRDAYGVRFPDTMVRVG